MTNRGYEVFLAKWAAGKSSLAIAMHGAPRLPWNAMDYMGI